MHGHTVFSPHSSVKVELLVSYRFENSRPYYLVHLYALVHYYQLLQSISKKYILIVIGYHMNYQTIHHFCMAYDGLFLIF